MLVVPAFTSSFTLRKGARWGQITVAQEVCAQTQKNLQTKLKFRIPFLSFLT